MAPSDLTLYDVLDVEPTATAAEVRKAYLALAREHHPDFHTSVSPAVRAANEREMQRINEAWAVLGDAARRRAYDDGLRERHREERRSAPGAASYDFRPLVEDDTDYAALLDDAPVAGTGVSRALQVLPAVGLLAGFAGVVVGMVIQVTFVLAFGVVLVALGALAFLATPLVAIMRSYQSDPDR